MKGETEQKKRVGNRDEGRRREGKKERVLKKERERAGEREMYIFMCYIVYMCACNIYY